ncbi:hypothetical protein [Stenotrophomonas indicatrix]|uniref:hypothetical protein n=1 Tax=Stenotrophomonas indicatrix TaxID=2045451 RepID=UPI0028AB19F4|nr:hypothetical protein [Stenotrophomonas indicatrix]
MDDRLKKIEALIPTLATKADLEKSAHDLVKWIVGTTFVGMGMFITIMTFVLNNAVSKPSAAPAAPPVTIQSAPPAPAPQPIIIQMPAQPQPPLANPALPPASKP